jgi:hypothetical protein
MDDPVDACPNKGRGGAKGCAQPNSLCEAAMQNQVPLAVKAAQGLLGMALDVPQDIPRTSKQAPDSVNRGNVRL